VGWSRRGDDEAFQGTLLRRIISHKVISRTKWKESEHDLKRMCNAVDYVGDERPGLSVVEVGVAAGGPCTLYSGPSGPAGNKVLSMKIGLRPAAIRSAPCSALKPSSLHQADVSDFLIKGFYLVSYVEVLVF
jgi:hypothetical protein